MANEPQTSIARRTFLQGAATTAGATLLAAGLPALADATPTGLRPTSPLAPTAVGLAYWDGVHLIPAQTLYGGDATLESVQVTLRGYGSAKAIKAIEAMYPVDGSSLAFKAWSAPNGPELVRFTMPVDAQRGITLSVQGQAVSLIPGKGRGFKLREGTYIVAPGATLWQGLEFDPTRTDGPLGSSIHEYVVLTVART